MALRVKLADLADNSDPARMSRLKPTERRRLKKKYALARQLLGLGKKPEGC